MLDSARNLSTTTRETVSQTDLSKNIHKIENTFAHYYTASPGAEHYRLLAHISYFTNGTNILDIGTYLGYSSIALSQNNNNKIISYDVNKQHNQEDHDNVTYRIGDARDFEDFENTKVILLDTYHDGVYEEKFIEHLRSIKWHGLLIMDDIHEYPQLKELYDKLPEEKYDITNIGHWSGTGIVLFQK